MAMEHLKFDFPEMGSSFDFNDKKPLFTIVAQALDDPANLTEITSSDFANFSQKEIGNITTLTFEGTPYSGGQSAKVIVTLKHLEQEVLGSIGIELGGGFIVRTLRFPYIVWSPVLPEDDLLMSTAWGDNIERPVKTIRERCGGELTYFYPSMLGMQYMALYSPARCVYVSSYSTSDETFTLGAKAINDNTIALSVNHHPFIDKGTWQSPEVGFSILKGDWHAAADLYRSHTQDTFKTPDIPQWMRDEFHGWVQVGMKFENRAPNYYFKDLPEVFKLIQETGLNTMHIFGWSGHAFDTEYPEFRINPELGTEEELKSAMDSIKEMGGHAILYTNGRLVDPATDYYKNTGGEDGVCINEGGKPYIERYGTSAEFRIACPVFKPYQQQMVSEVKKIISEMGAHAIQIDQISCNWGFFCFNKQHSHPTPSTNFLPGVDAILSGVRKAHKEVDPDFFVWCEGCNERFGQYYDVNQGHGEEFTWQIGESLPQQFKYNYPDYIVTGISDGIHKLCHTYAQGKPFDFHLHNLDNGEYAGLLKSLVAVRKMESEYFLYGVFKDNVGLDVTNGAKGFVIERKDGNGALVNTWIPGAGLNTESSVSIRLAGCKQSYRAAYPSDVAIEQDGSWLNLKWRGPVVTVIFE